MNQTFYKDSYKKNIECIVTNVKHSDKFTEVYLDSTIFYPECGGQPGDRGLFGPYKVLDTKKDDNTGDSIHIFEKECTVQIGDKYTLSLDWDHRYKYMAMHTCQHLLSGLLFSEFGIGTVAVHLGEDYLTIEIEKSEIDSETLEKLVKIANSKIKENHAVIYHEMSHKEAETLGLRRSIKVDGDVRIVEIQDVDRIACGGVHVASTSEIRLVYYYSQETIRGHIRLFFRCGEDAINYLLEDTKMLSEISESLTCSSKEVKNKLDNLICDFGELKNKFKTVELEMAKAEISKKIQGNIAVFETSIDLPALVSSCDYYDDLALCAINQNKWVIVLKGSYSGLDFNEFRKTLLPLIDAKGGGRTPVFQGIGQNMDKKEEFLSCFKSLVKKG